MAATKTAGKEIGLRIGVLRTEHGETQQELADAIGVSREIIQHWERGTRQIKSEAIVRLAKHFDTSTDYILGVVKHPTKNKDAMKIAEETGLTPAAVERLIHEKKAMELSGSFNVLCEFINTFLTTSEADTFDVAAFKDAALQIIFERSEVRKRQDDPIGDEFATAERLFIDHQRFIRDIIRRVHAKDDAEDDGRISVPAVDLCHIYASQATGALANAYRTAIWNLVQKETGTVDELSTFLLE